MENIICIDHITKNFRRKHKVIPVLSDISLTINKGDFIGIIGKSGTGKTTLLKIIGLLEPQYSGSYLLLNQNVNTLSNTQKARLRNEKLGFILQDYALIDSYTVMENVEIPLNYSKEKLTRKEKRTKVCDILKRLDMAHHIDDQLEH